MKYLSIFLVQLLVFSFFTVQGQTQVDPFSLTLNSFDELDLSHGKRVEDEEKNIYRVINDHAKKGLEISVDGGWKLHGIFFRFQSGILASETTYEFGIKHGKQTKYLEGIKHTEVNYAEGIKDGPYVTYYTKNGNKADEGAYKNNKKHGTQTTYFENGNKKMVTPYENGKVKGTVYEYNIEGNLKYENDHK